MRSLGWAAPRIARILRPRLSRPTFKRRISSYSSVASGVRCMRWRTRSNSRSSMLASSAAKVALTVAGDTSSRRAAAVTLSVS
ncbi:hypothetical protein G6F62_015485 [Rhizopus arrhizus]|nr:hypothetical protein G6F62_015485 [Rhizopus arrhizus]